MEGGLVQQGGDRVGHVNKVGYGKRIIVKKRKQFQRRIHKKTVPKSPKSLQALFLSCRETFKGYGTVPSSEDIQKLCHILDGMKPEDVGLRSDLQFFKPENTVKDNQRVTYTTIYWCKNFSLCLFFLPAKGVIPLHNHPGMTVFSKLLLGKMHIKSYDWVDPEDNRNLLHQPSHLRLARLNANDVFTAPCDTSVLYPKSGGNIHEFTAITPCVVLDVLGPPYSKEDDRDCSYYRDYCYDAFPYGESGKEKEESNCYGWLEEIEMLENHQMDIIEYLGPQVVETDL